MDGIKGKVVAITGASSGIGEAIARHLAGLGARVALGARRVDNLKDGQFVNITSVGDRWVGPTSTVYSATKFAVRAISDGLRQEVSGNIRVTLVAPGATESELAESISDPALKQLAIEKFRTDLLPAAAIARAVAYAVSQPADVDVNEIVVRPTAQKAL
ncbi:SDR family oxidoreductase [Parapedobacter deserti]|uniref:SDR family oxidoreductase n=1 Tax=Parapedobacter deserti TaxID=1912957 RepID=A0ABV7JKY0_9SPHI